MDPVWIWSACDNGNPRGQSDLASGKKVAEDLARFVNGDAEFYSCDAKEG